MSELIQALVDSELAKDEYWAEQFIKHGLITINGQITYDPDVTLAIGDKVSKIGFLIKCGKRKWSKVIVDKSVV